MLTVGVTDPIATGEFTTICLTTSAYYRTLVSTPGGETRCNRAGSPALGTAGSGDVLTGVVAALLAGGLSALDAATAGAWLHARAGELWEAESGAVGALATELRDRLPAARQSLYGPAESSVEEVVNFES